MAPFGALHPVAPWRRRSWWWNWGDVQEEEKKEEEEEEDDGITIVEGDIAVDLEEVSYLLSLLRPSSVLNNLMAFNFPRICSVWASGGIGTRTSGGPTTPSPTSSAQTTVRWKITLMEE